MKKYSAIFLSVIVIVLSLVGCGEEEHFKTYEIESKSQFVSTGEANGFSYIAYEDHSEIVRYDIPANQNEVSFPSSLGGKPVTVIAAALLQNNTIITSVDIPVTVEEIGNYCFAGCTALQQVTIPSKVKKIGAGAFMDTPWFKTLVGEFVTVGDGVLIKYDGKGGDIKIPKGVKYISNAFEYNQRITGLTLSDTVFGISDFAFYECYSLTEVDIPEGIYDIGIQAFEKSTWYDVLDDDFVIVGNGVLIGYRGEQTEVAIPDGVKYISGAFYCNENITKVTVPASVKFVNSYSFYGCKALTSVVFNGADTYFGENVLYDCLKLTSVKLPDNMNVLPSGTFSNCVSLKDVELPLGLKYIGAQAFYSCSALSQVIIPDKVTELGTGAFFGCGALTDISLPQSITKLGKVAFACCFTLNNVTLPPAVSNVSVGLFSYCKAMTEIRLSERIKSVAEGAFEACDNIKVYVAGEDTVFEADAFLDCTETAEIFCKDGSLAQSYANTNKIKVNILDQ